MRFIIEREEFLKGLLNASRIIQAKSLDPILNYLKLELNDHQLEITGSNGDLSILTTIPYFSNEKQIIRDASEGAILVNSKLITEIVKRVDGNEVKFDVMDDSIARVEAENSNFKLNVIRANEYREFDFEKNGIEVRLFTKDFVDAVNEVGFCASQKDGRAILTAINIECNSSTLTFTATDGARLGRKELHIENSELFNINVPAKALLEAVRSVTNEEEVSLFISDKKVIIALTNTILNSKLIPESYPNVKNIIPKTFNYYLEVNANEILNAMSRVSLFSTERENIVKLTMQEGKIVVSSKSQQTGSAEEELSLFKFTGDRLEISFNCDYVSGAIRALKSQDVMISFIGEMKPFTVIDKNNESIIQLITPVRTY